MLGIQVSQPRFTLYYLDEGEMFIKEFAVKCQFVYPVTETCEALTGVLHFGSRSLIFEPDDHNYSIIKFPFRNIDSKPQTVTLDNKDFLNVSVVKMIEIPQGKNTQPYRAYNLKSEVLIHFLFEKVEIVAQILYELLDKFNSKHTIFEFDSVEYLGNIYSFKFDFTRIKSINEKFLLSTELFVKKILPLIEVPGLFMITDKRIYFQPLFKLNTKKSFSLKYSSIEKLFKRRVGLREVGLEICCSKNKNLLIQTEQENDVEMLYELISKYISDTCETNVSIEKLCKLWMEGAMSNYDYLIALNSAANRTRNDLSQYPVFPWIISNYDSDFLDLADPNNYRDLSKPMGALYPKRLEMFRERYRDMPEPKFLYGTHYSNPAYVIGYLVRKYPHFMLKLHGGKFDNPDRLFNSVATDWEVCLTNPGSLKELIPEFYEDNPDFLRNLLDIDFGTNSKNEKVENVKLPPWATDATDFLKTMRNALESTYVSNNLHNWIDLIFGYKQRGQSAIEADNLFHPLTYETGIDTNSTDPSIIKIQVTEFGQVPKQLFTNPHPKRFSNKITEIFILEEKINLVSIEPNNVASPSNRPQLSPLIYEEIRRKSDTLLQLNFADKILDEKEILFNFDRAYTCMSKFHKKKITSSVIFNEGKSFVTGSEDGYIKVFDYKTFKIKRMLNVCNFSITSMAAMNSTSLIGIGATDNMIHIVNTSLGKEVSNIYAHEDSIVNVFHSPSNSLLITDGADSTCKIWDINNTNKIPLHVFYDTESKIISSDFRTKDNLHICIDQEGLLALRNIAAVNDCKKLILPKVNYRYVKFNKLNDNQYFVCTEDDFKTYDIRTHLVIDTVSDFADSINIFNDSKYFLLIKANGLFLDTFSSSKIEHIKSWTEFENISHVNMSIVNYQNPEMIIIGTQQGDVYYSN